MARRALDDTVIRAPFNGVVTVKAAQPGEIISPVSSGGFTRTGIGTVVDMDSLEVDVDVAESFINRVSPQMPASVRLNAYPDWVIPAEVIAVVPTADRAKATVSVHLALKAKDPRIVPEMGARVAFLASDSADAPKQAGRAVLLPPASIFRGSDRQPVVYVIDDGQVRRRAVRLGAVRSEGQVIVAGISPGEKVATSSLERLKDGAKVRVKTQSSSDQEP
jgi:RND family efflux transporter MFP subunit